MGLHMRKVHCSRCPKKVQVGKDGLLADHNLPLCPGSGKPVPVCLPGLDAAMDLTPRPTHLVVGAKARALFGGATYYRGLPLVDELPPGA